MKRILVTVFGLLPQLWDLMFVQSLERCWLRLYMTWDSIFLLKTEAHRSKIEVIQRALFL